MYMVPRDFRGLMLSHCLVGEWIYDNVNMCQVEQYNQLCCVWSTRVGCEHAPSWNSPPQLDEMYCDKSLVSDGSQQLSYRLLFYLSHMQLQWMWLNDHNLLCSESCWVPSEILTRSKWLLPKKFMSFILQAPQFSGFFSFILKFLFVIFFKTKICNGENFSFND